ncbi:DUF1565 domain-containing protein [Gloeobacter morelensis]|uniref:DUF1565 domain-containing protein n=1 Tax=Gloeobacter morelensis MG652769 TaxID=2781736 RepID=A0ABY3PK79_9CYAN|nr:DUF1565 domain-containing protein [Gloeobacter morelensis]UFP94031.1 DUF1565 domain-containing protein [Gloeobacter morelensis MG652769]
MKFSDTVVRRLMGWTLALSLLGTASASIVQAQSDLERDLSMTYVDAVNGDDSTADGSKQKPFKTITRAITASPPGVTLQLAEGEYSEATGEQFPIQLAMRNLVGNEATKGQGIKIVGGGKHVSPTFASQDATIVVGKEVTIRGVTITNPRNRGKGLWIESVSPVIAHNSFIGSLHDGIFITGASSAKVADNYFSGNIADGLTAADQSTPVIENNIFEKTGFAINVTGRSRPQIVGNTVRDNVDGIVIEGRSFPKLRNNTITGNRRSGVVVVLLASADMGTESEAGNNTFAANGRADVNNVTRPALPLVAMGNKWDKPRLEGQVTAEAEIIALAARNVVPNAGFWVLVSNTKPAQLRAIKGLALKPKSHTYEGKPYQQVGTFGSQASADKLVEQLSKKGFNAIAVPAGQPTGSNLATTKPTISQAPAKPAIAPQVTAKPATPAVVAAKASPTTPPETPITKTGPLSPGAPTVKASPATPAAPVAAQVSPVPPAAPKASPVSPTPVPSATAPVSPVLRTPVAKPAAGTAAATGPSTATPSETIAAKPASGPAYRVLVTDSGSADLDLLKELVARVIQQTYEGKPVLQVGVFSSEDNANRLVQTLSDKGFRAILVPVNQPG